jgi:hypothetical protein
MTSAVSNDLVSEPCLIGPWRWRIAVGFAHPDFLLRLSSPQQLLQPPAEPIERVPPRTATKLVRRTLPEYPAQPLFIKHYKSSKIWNRCKDVFRRSRARRAFENAFRLQKLGISTAPPVACGERRYWLWLNEAFLICEEVPHAETLHRFYQDCSDPRLRLAALRTLARQMAELHNAGFSHADPHALNFLVSRADCRNLVLIDLDALRQPCWFTFHSAVRDLRNMLRRSPLSARAHLRFAVEYARARAPRLSARKIVQSLGR